MCVWSPLLSVLPAKYMGGDLRWDHAIHRVVKKQRTIRVHLQLLHLPDLFLGHHLREWGERKPERVMEGRGVDLGGSEVDGNLK